jgi:diguanylate cyclase (GGDEF)-like protein
VICVCVAVELLCLYIGNMHRQISMDKLTQVNNRQNLFGFMSHKLKNHAQDLWLLMIDLDFFKTINDTYGHLEGDRALTRLAGVLKASCADILPRPYIARYGGDEFIIVLEGDETAVETLRAEIRRNLDGIPEGDAPYRLAVSIGAARWEEGMDNTALIAAADAELYRLKHAQ